MAPEDRDRTFEKALASHLRSGATQPGCLDAELLAAYHERLLAPEQMMSCKQHIASCTRCQEILAQLEATDDLLIETDRLEQVTENVLTMPAPQGTPELVHLSSRLSQHPLPYLLVPLASPNRLGAARRCTAQTGAGSLPRDCSPPACSSGFPSTKPLRRNSSSRKTQRPRRRPRHRSLRYRCLQRRDLPIRELLRRARTRPPVPNPRETRQRVQPLAPTGALLPSKIRKRPSANRTSAKKLCNPLRSTRRNRPLARPAHSQFRAQSPNTAPETSATPINPTSQPLLPRRPMRALRRINWRATRRHRHPRRRRPRLIKMMLPARSPQTLRRRKRTIRSRPRSPEGVRLRREPSLKLPQAPCSCRERSCRNGNPRRRCVWPNPLLTRPSPFPTPPPCGALLRRDSSSIPPTPAPRGPFSRQVSSPTCFRHPRPPRKSAGSWAATRQFCAPPMGVRSGRSSPRQRQRTSRQYLPLTRNRRRSRPRPARAT